jgi:predicted RNA binding protein YcfA (HicA-like mRNA interferase family)
MVHRLPSIDGEKTVKAFQKAGWKIKSQKGSHVKLVKSGFRTLIIPIHKGKMLDRGLLLSLIKHSRLSLEKFLELL